MVAAVALLLVGGVYAVKAVQDAPGTIPESISRVPATGETARDDDESPRSGDSHPVESVTTVAPQSAIPALAVVSGSGAGRNVAASGEWPGFRGAGRDNICRETGLLTTWPEEGPPLIRVIEGLGKGYSTVAVSRGVIYTLGSDGDSACLFSLDVASGDRLWSRRLGELRRDDMGDGPRSTPTVDGERVYGLSANGDLVCANITDGSVIWRQNILREFDADNIGWGISESPLIDGERLICTPGGRRATMVALNKNTGDVIWSALSTDRTRAGYASPVVCELDGVRQYVTFAHNSVFGLRASDGALLWAHTEAANGTANCATPIPWRSSVFYASGYGTGGALVNVRGNAPPQEARTAFFTREMKNHHGGMVIIHDHLYGCDDGILKCIDLETGDVAWEDRSVGKGSVVAADGHLYLRSEGGPVALIEIDPRRYIEKGRFHQPHRSDNAAWPHPVVCGGRLYLRDMDRLLVYDVSTRE